jgi:hypothetical protein
MKNVFVAQKRVIRLMLRLGSGDSCREGFKRMGILTVPSLYIYSVLLFVVRNPNFYQTNNNIHHINTRHATCVISEIIFNKERCAIFVHYGF